MPRYYPVTILADSPHLEALFIAGDAAVALAQPSELKRPLCIPASARPPVGLAETECILAVERDRRSLADLDRLEIMLSTFPELARAGPRELRQLARTVELRPFGAREVLLAPDLPGRWWLGVLRGSLSVHVGGGTPAAASADGGGSGGGTKGVSSAASVAASLPTAAREPLGRCTRVVGPGEMVGGLALLLENGQAATVVGRGEGLCLGLDGRQIPPLLLTHVRTSLQWPIFPTNSYVDARQTARSEYDIICLTEYMRTNPFFQQVGIDDKAIQVGRPLHFSM